LILFNAHSAGTSPYDDNLTTTANPAVHFTFGTDAATHDGFDPINVPSARSSWPTTTAVALHDPGHKNSWAMTLSKDAAELAYGHSHAKWGRVRGRTNAVCNGAGALGRQADLLQFDPPNGCLPRNATHRFLLPEVFP
jgi:hypothetical protein